MSNKSIFNWAVKSKEEKDDKNDSDYDPFEIIAELMSNLQNRIEELEKNEKKLQEEITNLKSEPKSKPVNKTRRVSHIRDPKTHQIISSIISEEDESDV